VPIPLQVLVCSGVPSNEEDTHLQTGLALAGAGTWPPSESMNVGMHSSSAHVHETHSREFSEATKTFLKVAFQADRFPSAKTRRLLATQLNLSHRQVQGVPLHILMVSPLTPPLACSARVPCM